MVNKDTFQLCESITEEEAIGLSDNLYTSNRKLDGERIIAVVKNGQVAMLNRRGYNPYKEFAEITEDLKQMPDCVLDGEVIDFTDTFNILQKRAGTRISAKQVILRKQIPVKYLVFDILQLNGQTLTGLILRDRVAKLQQVFTQFNQKFVANPLFHQSYPNAFIEMVEYEPIKQMLLKAHAEDREGIVVKTWNGIYEGKRGMAWLKCKFFLKTTIKVCSYTENPKGIRAEDKEGNVVQIVHQSQQVKQLIDTKGEVQINLQYLEKTADGRFKFPSFRSIVGEN